MKKELGIGLLLVMLCVIVAMLNPRFIGPDNIRNTTNLIGIYGIFSIGVGIVIITGGIELSVGSVFALLGVVFCMMVRGMYLPGWVVWCLEKVSLGWLNGWVWPWPLALVVVLTGAVVLGMAHGWLVARVRLQPFIVTLCGLLFYRGVARFVSQDESKGLGEGSYGLLETLTTGTVRIARFEIPSTFFLMVGIAAVMWVVLHRSVYGRYLFAVGRNEEAARYSGVNTRLVIGSAYVISMLLAGIAGILLVFYSRTISPANHGNFYELYAIAAAVLGGCSLRGGEGSILGILLGTALLQVLQNLVNLLGIPSSLNFAVMGAVILIGVIMDQVIKSRKGGLER